MDDDEKSSTKHSEKQKFEKELKCNDCDFTTRCMQDLKKHQDAIYKGVKHICNMCGKQFTDKIFVAVHKKSIHMFQKFDCDFCGYKATTQGSLTIHKQ